MKPGNATSRSVHSTEVPERQYFVNSRLLGTIAVTVWAILVATSLVAQTQRPSEYQVKAAYLYNFGKFVKWPASSVANQSNSFTICVLGDDPLGSVLQSTLAGQSIGGRPVAVRRIPKPQDGTTCHILFLNTEEQSHLREILRALGQASVLTVSDISDFSKQGGMIQFVMEGSRVRFEINRASAEDAGLVLTSDLLKVATAIRGTSRTGDQ
jgi:YfiR/HmsC-like